VSIDISLGDKFRGLREKIAYIQARLAKEMDLTIRSVTLWETEEIAIPRMAELPLKSSLKRRYDRKCDNGLQSQSEPMRVSSLPALWDGHESWEGTAASIT
jgi:DNA-binding XRE family transcriptional regulator